VELFSGLAIVSPIDTIQPAFGESTIKTIQAMMIADKVTIHQNIRRKTEVTIKA
jgi:hypothetical protein